MEKALRLEGTEGPYKWMSELARLLVALGLVAAVIAAPSIEVEAEAEGQIWAVLVAGSKGYYNYRHQSDVCHAYQILYRHGIPDDNIIVMMVDDIAYNPENPNQGEIINKPGGPNLYGPKSVPKDYTGTDVTPQNFVNVLTGNSEAMVGNGSGKVLKSGPNDHVFINFVDHGGTGIIGFPNGLMYADELIKALKTMHNKKMYKKLVFYLEACESGSMFYKILPENINIYATTAANPKESSYACYWDTTRKAYLGDEYSVSWMEDIDSEEHHKNITTETLLTQFIHMVERVVDSHPNMYGENSIDKDKVMDYLGNSENATFTSETSTNVEHFKDSVSNRDAALRTLEKKIELEKDESRKAELIRKRDEMIKGRKSVDELFSRILGKMAMTDPKAVAESHQPLTLDVMPCYKTVVNYFTKNCVNINKNTYTLAHLYKLANLCSAKISADDVLKVLDEECSEEDRELVGID